MVLTKRLAAVLALCVLRCHTSAFLAFFQAVRPADLGSCNVDRWFKLEHRLNRGLRCGPTSVSDPGAASPVRLLC